MELSQSDAQTGQSAGVGVVHRLGVIGLGRMGGAFAANLLAAGYEVHVFDPKADRVEALTVQGAQP
ncbi:MAG: NAD(P)-binding domain-containing protein, partial [Caulobacteraceae bacterium]|nr:NAD(P)-binding domain-containing protein [Caulobacteraceae bacterium]